jgi:hypothetical protein
MTTQQKSPFCIVLLLHIFLWKDVGDWWAGGWRTLLGFIFKFWECLEHILIIRKTPLYGILWQINNLNFRALFWPVKKSAILPRFHSFFFLKNYAGSKNRQKGLEKDLLLFSAISKEKSIIYNFFLIPFIRFIVEWFLLYIFFEKCEKIMFLWVLTMDMGPDLFWNAEKGSNP